MRAEGRTGGRKPPVLPSAEKRAARRGWATAAVEVCGLGLERLRARVVCGAGGVGVLDSVARRSVRWASAGGVGSWMGDRRKDARTRRNAS